MKLKTLILLSFWISFLSLSACTSAQHIRAQNYYNHDWSLAGQASSSSAEAYQHHPIMQTVPAFQEGKPTYSSTLNYYVWGAFPWRHTISMSQACGDKPFRQAYIQHNFGQALISFFTLGIYTPRTIDVWCGDVQAKN